MNFIDVKITKGTADKIREEMNFIDVKNKKEMADKIPLAGFENWLDFWEKMKGKKATKCGVLLCKGSPDLGGHVIKAGEESSDYILPMCYSCNKPKDEAFKVWDNDLVPMQ